MKKIAVLALVGAIAMPSAASAQTRLPADSMGIGLKMSGGREVGRSGGREGR